MRVMNHAADCSVNARVCEGAGQEQQRHNYEAGFVIHTSPCKSCDKYSVSPTPAITLERSREARLCRYPCLGSALASGDLVFSPKTVVCRSSAEFSPHSV